MKRINVICPVCQKFKRLEVPRKIFNIDEGYLLKLPIDRGEVCTHEFLVLLDYHFSIRDYEIPNDQPRADHESRNLSEGLYYNGCDNCRQHG